MPKAIQMNAYGNPSVLKLAEIDLPPLPPDEIRFRIIAAAINHADVEIRSGKWLVMRDNILTNRRVLCYNEIPQTG